MNYYINKYYVNKAKNVFVQKFIYMISNKVRILLAIFDYL